MKKEGICFKSWNIWGSSSVTATMTITALYASDLRVTEIWSWCVCQLLWPSLYGMLVASEYLKSGPDVFVFYHFPRFLQFICLVCSFDWLMLILLIACRSGSFSGSWTFIIVDFYNTNLIHVYKCHWIGQDLFFIFIYTEF